MTSLRCIISLVLILTLCMSGACATPVTWGTYGGYMRGYNDTHTFWSWTTPGNYTWVVPNNVTTVSYFVQAPGGGGGAGSYYNYGGGGGGAGGLTYGSGLNLSGQTSVTVMVGARGIKGSSTSSVGGVGGSNGGNSSFYTATAMGGGGGSGGYNNTGGLIGGSGGGTGGGYAINGGLGVSGQGNNGGAGITSAPGCSGGSGGGSSGAGLISVSGSGSRAGGTGTFVDLGGAGNGTYSIGGASGSYTGRANGSDPIDGTGNGGMGGGGGNSQGAGIGGDGATGIIIISYPKTAEDNETFSNWVAYGDAWRANGTVGSVLMMWNTSGSHTFVTLGNTSTILDYIIVAGGGGAGGGSHNNYGAGGGGAGGFIVGGVASNSTLPVSGTLTISVGAAGIGASGQNINGQSGGNSTLVNLTAYGGGWGSYGYSNTVGGWGGSGGGTGGGHAISGGSGYQTGTVLSQGNNGGASVVSGSGTDGGSGGGAAGAGTAATSIGSGKTGGGSTLAYLSSTFSQVFSSGGNSGASSGGANGASATVVGGGGQGGAGGFGSTGGAGGYGKEGIIIIRFAAPVSKSAAPVASFTANKSAGAAPLAVGFTDTSTNTPTAWQWTLIPYSNSTWLNFSTSQNPTLTISEVGNYSIMLSASNALGASNTSPVGSWINTTLPTLTASYTPSINPVATGSNVSLNWSGVGTPITYDYGFGDGSANESTRNVSHKYSLPGTYYTFLNVTDAYGSYSRYTSSETVYNATGDNYQDIVMAPRFSFTIHITDKDNGLPIPVVATVTDTTNALSNTTTAGTTTLFEDYSVVVGTIVAEGYQARSFQAIVDSDMEATYQMTKATAIGVQQQVYPHYVTFHIKEGLGSPVEGVNVSALGVSTSTGSWDWIIQLLGLPLDEVPINGTYMNQTTDSLGRATFYMIPTGKYNVTFSKTGYTITPMVLVPQDTDYVVFATSSSEPYFRNGTDELSAVNISITTRAFNESYAFINLTYTDSTGGTTGGTIRVLQKSDTPWAANTVMASWPVTGNSFTNSTGILHLQQVSGYVESNITHSTFGTVQRSYPYSFNSVPVPFLGFGSDIALLVAFGIMMFTLMLAGAAHVRPVLFLTCIEGWVFDAMHWFDSLIARGVPHESVWLALSIATVIAMLANFEMRKKKEKY